MVIKLLYYSVVIFNILILDVFTSRGAMFVHFYCYVANVDKIEWLLCVWTCACLFVSRSADLSAFKSTRRSLGH